MHDDGAMLFHRYFDRLGGRFALTVAVVVAEQRSEVEVIVEVEILEWACHSCARTS